MHAGSRIESTIDDFLARLLPIQDVQGIQETRMRRWVELHARLQDQTIELLRALNLAEHFRI